MSVPRTTQQEPYTLNPRHVVELSRTTEQIAYVGGGCEETVTLRLESEAPLEALRSASDSWSPVSYLGEEYMSTSLSHHICTRTVDTLGPDWIEEQWPEIAHLHRGTAERLGTEVFVTLIRSFELEL